MWSETMEVPPLQPCPICGGAGRYLEHIWLEWDAYGQCNIEIPIDHYVECTQCWVRTKECRDMKDAVETWNRRYDNGRIESDEAQE